MSLYGMMRTGVSGMQGQANRLSTVADNIANANTTGYKRSETEFSSLIVPNTPGLYNSGGVKTSVRYDISKQGTLQYTSSGSDLAINGSGFFVVQSGNGQQALARAGSFVPDGSGRLVNAAGYYLMGYSFANGEPSAVANGYSGLEIVSIGAYQLTVTPSTDGNIKANLPATATTVAPPQTLPSANQPGASYSNKTSIRVVDNAGAEKLVDVYFTKTGDNTWEATVFDQSTATAGTSFPYTSAPLTTLNLEFDPTTRKLVDPTAAVATFTIPNGSPFNLDMSALTHFASDFDPNVEANGNGPSSVERIEISTDGTVYAQYESGEMKALYRIPLASVASPDQLRVMPGNTFALSQDSGDLRLGFPNQSGLGSVVSGALEGSNVDIAEELTDMIEAQRNYTANSKVFQTGSDLLDILVNLKR